MFAMKTLHDRVAYKARRTPTFSDLLARPVADKMDDRPGKRLGTAMLRLNIVEPERLRQHYQNTPLGERESLTAGRNLTLLLRELGQP